MKRLIPLLLITFFSCSNRSSNNGLPDLDSVKNESSTIKKVVKPLIVYEVVNEPDNISNSGYDIYIKDISKISVLNDYLINQYNPAKKDFLTLNYFNNRKVAKIYFKKQFSELVSESEKDKLFKYYIATYKFNPSTGFDKLSFFHQ